MKVKSKLTMLVFLLCFLFVSGQGVYLAASEGVQWSYEGDTGPDHWCELDEAFALCCEGVEQSPINITDTIPASTPVVAIHYDEKNQYYQL